MLGSRVRKHTKQEATISVHSSGARNLVSVNCRAPNGLGCIRFSYPLVTVTAKVTVLVCRAFEGFDLVIPIILLLLSLFV